MISSSGMISVSDQTRGAADRAQARSDSRSSCTRPRRRTRAEALLEKLVDALLDLFPQAEDVGVLVEDERTGELRVQCQRHRVPLAPDTRRLATR